MGRLTNRLLHLLVDAPLAIVGWRLARPAQTGTTTCRHDDTDCCDNCCECRCDGDYCCDGTRCGGTEASQ